MSAGPMRFGEGAILEGRYRLDRIVGEGGFGVVYAGWHLRLDIAIAVKVVDASAASFEGGDAASVAERAASFLDEARMLSRLRHPNIVRVLDAGVSEDASGRPSLLWLVMEWCGTTTLRDHLKARPGPRSLEETRELLAPIVGAVGAAHAAGIAHRDIKPSNVMVVDEGGATSARLIDFGIAKRIGGEGGGSGGTWSVGRRAFTPRYAAPEQVAGTRTGTRTDVHALALLVTEMLVGEPPYGADPDAATIVGEARPTPRTFGVDAGPWEDVLARALAQRPADRYEDARALLRALDEAWIGPRGERAAAVVKAAIVEAPRKEEANAVEERTALATLEVASTERDRTASHETKSSRAEAVRTESAWTPRTTRVAIALSAIAIGAGALGVKVVRSTASRAAATSDPPAVASVPATTSDPPPTSSEAIDAGAPAAQPASSEAPRAPASPKPSAVPSSRVHASPRVTASQVAASQVAPAPAPPSPPPLTSAAADVPTLH